MKRTTASYDTERPLTEEERAFSALPENHDLIYKFCAMEGYNVEEFYDILAVAYIQCVKKYHEVTRIHEDFAFSTILFHDLRRTMGNHFRAMNTKKRMPEGGRVSLDMMVENNKMDYESRIEKWWIDPEADIERQIIRSENHKDFCGKFNQFVAALNQRIADHEYMAEELKTCVEYLIKGYTRKKALRIANQNKERRKGYGYKNHKHYTFTYIFNEYEDYMLEDDLTELRKTFKEIFGI